MTNSGAQLPNLLQALQRRLESELGIAREVIGHSTTKGDVSEGRWIEMMTEHLPARYIVSKAFIIDSKNQCSEQIDVVIHDRQYSPFVFTLDAAKYVPAESVYAAFEVKQSMSKDQLGYASQKVRSVRKLHRTSIDIHHAQGVAPAKPPQPIVGGLLCLESDWSPAFGQPFHENMKAFDPDSRLDFVCSVKHGVAELDHTQANPTIDVTLNNAPLAFLLLRLIARLQNMATVPCLDVMAYANWIPAS